LEKTGTLHLTLTPQPQRHVYGVKVRCNTVPTKGSGSIYKQQRGREEKEKRKKRSAEYRRGYFDERPVDEPPKVAWSSTTEDPFNQVVPKACEVPQKLF